MNSRISRFVSIAALALLAAMAGRAAEPAAAGQKVNINQASVAQLSNLPRVGTKLAQRVVEYRKEHGPFSQAEQMMEVKGVGEKLYKELKPYVELSGPTTLTSKVSSRGTRGGSSGKKSASMASAAVPVGKGR